MKLFYSDLYPLPPDPEHRFPVRKYALLRETVAATDLGVPQEWVVAESATDEQIRLAHDADYLERVKAGRLTTRELRRLGLPWSPALVERARQTTGGTVGACRAALRDGVAVNLAGGYHHAFRDHGQGYCVFNDIVIAARVMQTEGRVRRVLVLDCDVHQGNGTAALTADDPTIFTFSLHNAQNFPLRKEASDLDIGLGDGTGDAAYLEALTAGVGTALERARADLAIYLAGADPYEDDLLGRFAVSQAGLAERDRLVFAACRASGLPVAVTMAGGYARRVEDVVAIHVQTIRLAAEQVRKV